jgi:hypothetical protein
MQERLLADLGRAEALSGRHDHCRAANTPRAVANGRLDPPAMTAWHGATLSGVAPTSERRGAWRSVLIAFVLLVAFNTVLGLLWTVVGFPLRGMDYEPGRPTPEDIQDMHLVDLVMWTLLAANLLVPIYFALRRRFAVVLGLVAAWIASPMVFWLSILTLGTVRILLE